MSRLLRWVSFYFKYGVPLAVVAVASYVIVEQFNPWKAAELVLPHLANETRVSVGAGVEFRGDQSERHAEYVYFPSHLRDGKVYVVRQHNSDPITLEETEGSIVSPLAVLFFVLAIVGSAWFWVRGRREAQPNKSLERTRDG